MDTQPHPTTARANWLRRIVCRTNEALASSDTMDAVLDMGREEMRSLQQGLRTLALRADDHEIANLTHWTRLDHKRVALDRLDAINTIARRELGRAVLAEDMGPALSARLQESIDAAAEAIGPELYPQRSEVQP